MVVQAAEADEEKKSDEPSADGAANANNETAPAEEQKKETKKTNNSIILKWFITIVIAFSFLFCMYRLCKDYIMRNYREKINISAALGLALAYISNEED